MTKTYLKIKIKTLAAEARIIRAEERKWPGPSDIRTRLVLHRKHNVRDEARASLLAYGFLRGRPYTAMEDPALVRKPMPFKDVEKIAARFGGFEERDFAQRMEQWTQEAKEALAQHGWTFGAYPVKIAVAAE